MGALWELLRVWGGRGEAGGESAIEQVKVQLRTLPRFVAAAVLKLRSLWTLPESRFQRSHTKIGKTHRVGLSLIDTAKVFASE